MIKRSDFPLLHESTIIYLDNASTTQKTKGVIDTLQNFYQKHNANPGRGIYQLAEEATVLYEKARKTVAHFIGADSDEIIFTKNATEGINCIAQGWAREHLKAGDEIVLTELEHHANLLAWLRVAKQTGAIIRYIPIDKNGMLDMSQLDKIITSKTKLVACTQTSNAIGTVVDIAPIIVRAHAVGALVLVDACQSVPFQKIDVKKMGADFLVFSGHKMLGPMGIGVLYIAKKIHNLVEPLLLGGGVISDASYTDYKLLSAPQKFEAGTQPVAEAIGLAAAIDYLASHDFPTWHTKITQLSSYLINQLQKITCISIIGPVDHLKKYGHIVSFVVKGVHAHDVAAYLDQQGICVRAGHFCAQPLANKMGYTAAVRVSLYIYNTREEIDALIKALKQLCVDTK